MITAQDFMSFFRDAESIRHLTTEDRREIFLNILADDAEVTYAVLQGILRKYNRKADLAIVHTDNFPDIAFVVWLSNGVTTIETFPSEEEARDQIAHMRHRGVHGLFFGDEEDAFAALGPSHIPATTAVTTDGAWVTVADERVRHVWLDEETGETVVVPPDFYQDNGEPCGDDGEVYTYLRTEVEQPPETA